MIHFNRVLVFSFVICGVLKQIQCHKVQKRGVAACRYIWQKTDIPVCWENYNPALISDYNLVKGAVVKSWMRYSHVNFYSWGACKTNSTGIRINVADRNESPHTTMWGNALDGIPNGMSLNFNFYNWDPEYIGYCCCESEHRRRQCIAAIAVHEMGHALGLIHEDYPYKLTTPRCGIRQIRPLVFPPVCHLTKYDSQSIMNPLARGRIERREKLSELDILTIQLLYGCKN